MANFHVQMDKWSWSKRSIWHVTCLRVSRKINKQKDIVKVVTRSKEVEYTPLKLHKNKTRNSKNIETQHKHMDIIFGNNSRMCKRCLNELWKQGKIEKCIYQERPKEHRVWDICCTLANAVEDDEMLMDQKTGEVINSVADTYHKEKFIKFL